MGKMIHKRILAGTLAVALLCTPMQIRAAETAQTADPAQITEQDGSADERTDAQEAQNEAYYTVSFHANSGTKIKTTLTLKSGDTYGTLPKTSRDGYKFLGWYTKKQGGTRVKAASVFKGMGDQTLYAHWKKQTLTTETQPKQLAEAAALLVSYTGNKNSDYQQNDYTGFLVLKNFKTDYLYCQYDYDRFVGSSGKNVGCTATADAMLASIYRDKPFSPNDEGWIPGVGATWTNSVVLSGSKSYSVKKQCQVVSDYLNQGIPVMIRVVGHSVTAIGVREGVTRDKLTPADILIADPADGKVKCANEMSWRVMTNANGWGLRIPKDGGITNK